MSTGGMAGVAAQMSNLLNDFDKNGVWYMGGKGSGNWYRWDRKTTTEERRDFDIRVLRRSGQLYPGYRGTYHWSENGESAGSIIFQVESHRIMVAYCYRVNGGDWEYKVLPVVLLQTPCNYGGSRPWFVCPTSWCSRRVAVLYNMGENFVCRHCSDLVYSSQQERIYDRMMRKTRKIRKRLGGKPGDEMYPEKPKHMHWSTYNRLIEEASHYESLSWELAGKCL